MRKGISGEFGGHIEAVTTWRTKRGRQAVTFGVRFIYVESLGGGVVRTSIWTDAPEAVLALLRPGCYVEIVGSIYLAQWLGPERTHHAQLCCAADHITAYRADHAPVASLRQIGVAVEIVALAAPDSMESPASVPAELREEVRS